MDDIEKFFKKLSNQEYEVLMLVYEQIKKDYLKVPGIVKLSGYKNLYRVRVGRIRLIFKVDGKKIEILRITKRDEKTYKGF
jgi:mRNA-degrading endonuclease RelE of RelBE toxin-antitoxin system